MNRLHLTALCISLSALTAACLGEDLQGGPELSQSWESFRANPPVRWEAFRATVSREPTASYHFIVDGDIPLETEEELRAFYEAWLAQEYRATNSSVSALTVMTAGTADVIWPAAQRNALTYCISNTFGTQKATVVAAMAEATASWSAVANVGFIYLPAQDATCTATNPNVLFNVSPYTSTNFAEAFFPNATRANRQLQISPAAFTTTAGGRTFQGILRHETGHILGFRHEHINISCTDEGPADSRLVTAYDVNSVMHYPQCRPSRTGGYVQSALDELGATMLYGAPRTTECLFDWAQINYPTLFAPAATTAVSGNFVYRFYAATNSYLGINVTDQNVYYQAPGGTPQSQGAKTGWLATARCN
jgi:hypothetical protein